MDDIYIILLSHNMQNTYWHKSLLPLSSLFLQLEKKINNPTKMKHIYKDCAKFKFTIPLLLIIFFFLIACIFVHELTSYFNFLYEIKCQILFYIIILRFP